MQIKFTTLKSLINLGSEIIEQAGLSLVSFLTSLLVLWGSGIVVLGKFGICMSVIGGMQAIGQAVFFRPAQTDSTGGVPMLLYSASKYAFILFFLSTSLFFLTAETPFLVAAVIFIRFLYDALRAERRFYDVSRYNGLGYQVGFVLISGPLVAWGLGHLGLVLFTVNNGLLAMCLFFLCGAAVQFNGRVAIHDNDNGISKGSFLRLLSYISVRRKLGYAQLIGLLGYQLLLWVIATFLPEVVLGVMALCTRLTGVANLFSSAVEPRALAEIRHISALQSRDRYLRIYMKFAPFLIFPMLFMLLLPKFIYCNFFGVPSDYYYFFLLVMFSQMIRQCVIGLEWIVIGSGRDGVVLGNAFYGLFANLIISASLWFFPEMIIIVCVQITFGLISILRYLYALFFRMA